MSRRKAHIRIAILALCAGGMAGSAQALPQRCGPLKQVASLEMTALGDGARESVTLAINGTPVRLLVDTGAGMSSLTGPAATQLGIRPRDSATMHLVNQDGAAIRRYYVADSFQLGPLTARNVPFMQDAALDDARVEGAIGPDLMARYDVEMDFAGQR
jgi:predicted aspartyl protease